MRRALGSLLCLAFLAALTTPPAAPARAGDFPEPSIYPISWELKFEHGKPKRIVVTDPGKGPSAYWYLTYTVTNETETEQTFLPRFEMMTSDGQIVQSDRGISPRVFEAVKRQEGNKFLEPRTKMMRERLRVGEDQARDGVAIWKEPMSEMGNFNIFVTGLSGEFVTMKMVKGKMTRIDPTKVAQELKGVDEKDVVILRKTLQLNYVIYGDEVYAGLDEVNVKPEQWVMR
jgi:hypothetical protein